jgi:phage/plasmid-like protein (TIGR03299 family)
MSMETAGSLDGGKIVWALAKINKSFSVIKDDIVEGYMLFSNPHKYGRAINIKVTPIRVVCNNTLTMALNQSSKDSISINHRNVFDAVEAKKTLQIAGDKMEMYAEKARFLSQKTFTDEQLTEYLKQVFPVINNPESKELSRPAQTVLDVIDSQPGAEFGRGTWWQAYNGVTFATDHLLGRSADSRLKSAWFGINENRKLVALHKAVQFAEAA